jgi:hypothetical protein
MTRKLNAVLWWYPPLLIYPIRVAVASNTTNFRQKDPG